MMDIFEARRLDKEYGSPLYIFDEASFINNYQDFVATMKTKYPQYRLSYSFKTNYTPYICSLVKELGGYAEVVSDMEYEIALRIGYDPKKVVFNGPDKGIAGVEALFNGSLVNADHLEEVKTYCAVAQENIQKEFSLGLRVNLDIGQSFISRFGMSVEDVKEACRLVRATDNIKISGLHCHISRCRGREAWKKRTVIMLSLADDLFNGDLDYIDLGSGMFGKMAPEFQKQFSNIPTYEEYADVTASVFENHYKDVPENKRPILFTEPGTTIVNKYISCIGKVKAIKQIKEKTFAVLNCSEHNLGETCLLKRLPIEIIHNNNQHNHYINVDFVGYTCLEQDVMYSGYSGNLAIDDYVLFDNVGGYSNVYKPPFIKPNCSMVVRKENGQYHIIKRTETFDDLLKTYVF